MNWITIVFSAISGICLALAGVHLFTWIRSRDSWGSFYFSLSAVAAAACAQIELAMMQTENPESYGELLRWLHLPAGVIIISVVWFIYWYLHVKKAWLAWVICCMRVFAVAMNFVLTPNLNFREITGLRYGSFLGEAVSIPIGTASPWSFLNPINSCLFLIFVLYSSITAWKRGEHRRSFSMGGVASAAIILGIVFSALMVREILPIPLISILFLLIVLVMAYELGRDLSIATQTSRELQRSEQRIRLATKAANLGVWEWDIMRDTFWINEPSRSLPGVDESEHITFNRFLQSVHPDDREATRLAFYRTLESGGDFEWEYRLLTPDGATRLISALGQVERSEKRKPLRSIGILRDVTELKKAENEKAQLLNELAHLSRVTTMNELSTSLAHEINQPLGAILNNATAAQTLNSKTKAGRGEFEEILSDIIEDTRRMGEIIRKIRGMVKKEETKFEQLNLNILIERVVDLYRNMLNMDKTSISLDLQPDLAPVRGDGTRLQQVIMNLISNATEALRESPTRTIKIRTIMQSPDMIIVSISDSGTGIEMPDTGKVFESFYTTKKGGLGLGLRICRSIIQEHGGRIWAENNPRSGATFSFSLKAYRGEF